MLKRSRKMRSYLRRGARGDMRLFTNDMTRASDVKNIHEKGYKGQDEPWVPDKRLSIGLENQQTQEDIENNKVFKII